jgi:hypothetical protein
MNGKDGVVRRRGRPPVSARPMTAGERQARRRGRLAAAAAAAEADHVLMEAAWSYVGAAQDVAAAVRSWAPVESIADSVMSFATELDALARARGVSDKAHRRARFLSEYGSQVVRRAKAEFAAAEPLAVDARHGTLGTVAGTLLAGGPGGPSLHSASLVLLPPGFNTGASEGAGGIKYEEDVAPSLQGAPGGSGAAVVERGTQRGRRRPRKG